VLNLLAVIAAIRPVSACSLVAPPAFTLDPGSDDIVPPAPPGDVVSVRINRGHGPACVEGRLIPGDTCDDLGTIYLTIQAAMDDRSPEPKAGHVQSGVGYRTRLVAGTLPDGLTIDDTLTASAFDFEHVGAAELLFWSVDEGKDGQDAFSATLAVKAVDLAGNESAETSYEVSDPGTPGEQACLPPAEPPWCGAPIRTEGAGVVVGVGLAALRRKRRPFAPEGADRP
jgi:hypothetical protein